MEEGTLLLETLLETLACVLVEFSGRCSEGRTSERGGKFVFRLQLFLCVFADRKIKVLLLRSAQNSFYFFH